MTYVFTVTTDNRITVTAPTEEDAWDRFFEVTNTPLPNNVVNITCECTGNE